MLNNAYQKCLRCLLLLSLGLAVINVQSGSAGLKFHLNQSGQKANQLLNRVLRGGKSVIEGTLPISYEEEVAIGEAMALQVMARFGGAYENASLTRYVNLVGQSVAVTSDRPDIPYHFAILNHHSLNAFAAPGGYVFITKGLLKHLRNEAELAAVLGHEIAHVSEKHILKIIQRQKQLAGVKQLMPATFKGLVDDAVSKLLDEGLDQRKELAADRLGVHFAARVGYDPHAYYDLLQRLRALKGDNHAVFKTHPHFSRRIEEVEKTLASLPAQPRRARLAKRFNTTVSGRL